MYEETIELVLRFCKRNISFFLVSKVFERIYIEIIYTPEVSNKLLEIACYENDQLMIEMLRERQLIDTYKIDEELKYWSYRFFKIYWMKIGKCGYYNLDNFIDSNTVNPSSEVPEKYLTLTDRLLNHFFSMRNKFIRKSSNLYRYKQYKIKYINCDSQNMNGYIQNECRYLFFLDYKNGNFLVIASLSKRSRIMCNMFNYMNSNILPCFDIGSNLDELFSNVYKYYDICCKCMKKL